MTISILSVITHFSSRFHGERNGTLNGFHVEEKTTEYIYRLAVEKKLSSRRIAKLLEEKGIRGKVKGKECTIKWFHIDRLLERITPNMNKLLGSKDKNNFTMFAKENIIQKEGGELSSGDIERAYNAWCRQRGEPTLGRITLYRMMAGQGWRGMRRRSKTYGNTLKIYEGLALREREA